ncbi:hypothetical protein PUN28_015637 [Cardiocondyla obscurior]|uniref:Uncharacterized protein n=1 Tax=Cardiocondyla obscurior TaxID=286306 RepID=A0AAW2EU28_9HYME
MAGACSGRDIPFSARSLDLRTEIPVKPRSIFSLRAKDSARPRKRLFLFDVIIKTYLILFLCLYFKLISPVQLHIKSPNGKAL